MSVIGLQDGTRRYPYRCLPVRGCHSDKAKDLPLTMGVYIKLMYVVIATVVPIIIVISKPNRTVKMIIRKDFIIQKM